MNALKRALLACLTILCPPALAADYYTASGDPASGSSLSSSVLRAEYAAIAAGFVKIAPYTSAGSRLLYINTGATAQTTDAELTYNGTTNVLTVSTSTFGANTSIAGTLGVTGVATLTAQPILSSLTASRAVFTDSSKGLVSNTITGTGDVVMSTSAVMGTPTITSPAITTSITTVSASFTALAGATTNLTIGGTGATAVVAIPGTLEATGTAGAFTVAGGVYVAKALNAAGLITASAGATVASGQTLTLTGATLAGAPTWSSNQAITLSTAAQPNITSVGTLTSLAVTGALSATGASTLPTIYGSSVANGDLTLEGTSHATKTTSYVILQPNGGNVGIGTTGQTRMLTIQGSSLSTNSQFLYLKQPATDEGWSFNIDTQTTGNLWIRGVNAGVESTVMSMNRETGNVGIGTTSPSASALLDLTSTTGAFLPPRMITTQRDALTPINGMIIYNSTTGALNYYKAGAWTAI